MNPFASAMLGKGRATAVANTLNYSFTGGALPSGVTPSGGAGGRLVNTAGLLVSASTPRFDYHPLTHAARGLLVEPAGTNLCLQSESFDSATWSKTSIVTTANATVAPDGTNTADLVAATSTGAFMNQAVANVMTAAFTYSCFFKAGNFQWLRFVVQSASGAHSAQFWFDLTNRVAGVGVVAAGSPTITAFGLDDAGGGWCRCWATVQVPSETSALLVLLAATGNGSGAQPANAQYYVWGGQIEQSLKPTSYIGPTTTVSASRSADAIGFVVPAATGRLVYAFDDASQQTVATVPGAYTVPATLNRARIVSITGTA
ncbi:hypothetical protein [Novosphingobium sp.]|uniref:phage head spike fiber domain-containing protein n=1 Tax=Novosphingobium sp. TaxID=1874826 RepID=UPI0025EBDC46|nr:hypothetical protein [Novosphingobium sp.]